MDQSQMAVFIRAPQLKHAVGVVARISNHKVSIGCNDFQKRH